MNTLSTDQPELPEDEAKSPVDKMDDQLRGDVNSWMAARSESAARQTDFSVPVTKPPATKQVARAKPVKPAATAPDPAGAKKKPFGMSYDGMSQADYITYMISRGAR